MFDLRELPAAALAERLVEIRQQIDRLEAEFASVLGQFNRRQGYQDEGSLSLASWLRHHCGMSHGSAVERATIARQFDELPATADAFASGDFGYDSARILARTASLVGTDAYRPGEAEMIKAARKLDAVQLRMVAGHLRHWLDREGALADANDVHDRRFLHVSQSWEGRYRLDGEFDPETGATVVAALNALMPPPSPDDERYAYQRRADALVEICRQQLDSGNLPEVAGQKPHLSLLVRNEQGGAGELDWGGFIPAETVERIACDCALTMLKVDSDDQPVAATAASRTVPPSLRRALVARDGGCRFPGCDRPADWTDGHHLKHWAQGGQHKLKNLVLLCRRHHRRVHEGKWRLAWGERGELLAAPP